MVRREGGEVRGVQAGVRGRGVSQEGFRGPALGGREGAGRAAGAAGRPGALPAGHASLRVRQRACGAPHRRRRSGMTPYTKERVQKTHRLCSLRLKRVSLVGSPPNEAPKRVLFKSPPPPPHHALSRNSPSPPPTPP